MLVRGCVVFVLLLFCAVEADGRHISLGLGRRQLQEVNTVCPAGCDADGCVLDSTSGGYKCIHCKGSLLVNSDNGSCECRPGYYGETDTCDVCEKGMYCSGGQYMGPGSPAKISCGPHMTTLGRRSSSVLACVNTPGTYYVLIGITPSAVPCPANTYGPGLKKQRACVPCPPGYVTAGLTGQTSAQACVVPEGYFLKGPGQVAPCPRGQYKSGFGFVGACTTCAAGVTTAAMAATSEADCNMVLPTLYPSVVEDGVVKATQPCPQSHWCAGGAATAAFDPAAPAALAGTTVQRCQDGTWTEDIGAWSPSQCLTPPGYKTTNGTTTPCTDGKYRSGWQIPALASSCQQCGDGILSHPDGNITLYNITADATPSQLAVRTSAASCYVKAGQGVYYSSITGSFRALNCDSDNWGAANPTHGLSIHPCRPCPSGMIADANQPSSAAHLALDDSTPALGGFTSPLACVTKPGHGYNGWYAAKCEPGWYNAGGNYAGCTQCPTGLTTPDDASRQTSAGDCALMLPGYGYHLGEIQLCPLGTYNSDLQSDLTKPCEPCGLGLVTLHLGATSADLCVPPL